VLSTFHLISSPLDLTPFAFTVAGLAVAWALFRYRLLDVMPVARRAVVDGMSDGVIVLDVQGRVLDLNPVAQQIVGARVSDVLGRPVAEVFADYSELVERYCDVTEARTEVALGEGEAQRHYDLSISSLHDRYGRPTGRLIVLRDITERQQAEAALMAQKQLLENLVAVARAAAKQPNLEATLQNVLDVAITLTEAELGSIFLLDESGAVTHSILARGTAAPAQRQEILSRVMEAGLAGWVARHRQSALVQDTARDDRWLTLLDVPYTARSALAVPILSGSTLLSVLTLQHPTPGHFNSEHAGLMQAAADQMALAVCNAQIFDAQRRIADRQTAFYEALRTVAEQTDPDYVARAAVEAITRIAGWPNVVIALPDDDETHWVIRAASGTLLYTTRRAFSIEQGVIGRAFRTAQTQFVPGVSADLDYIVGHPDIRSQLAVPMRRGGRTLGVISIESDRLAAFDADDVRLVESLAEAVALALNHARLYNTAHQHAANLSALYTITRMASQSLVLEDVLSQTLSSALKLLGFQAGLVGLADPADGRLRLAAEHGLPPPLSERLRRDGLDGTLCAYVHFCQEGLVVGDIEQEVPVDAQDSSTNLAADLAALGFRSYAGIPLLHREQSLGSMSLFSHRRRTSLTDASALLTTIGHQVATAVANARLFQTSVDEHSRLQALIESSRDGIVLIGTDLRMLVTNAPALELLRLPGEPEDWTNRSVRDALMILRRHAPAMVRASLATMRRIQRGDERPGEGEYKVPPRTIHWLNLPVLAGDVLLGHLVVLRDVTQERLLEKMRDDLTHTMVHDLRSPLTGVSVSLQFLTGKRADNLSPSQRRMLNIAREGTEKMIELVDNILDVSRLESGRMPLQRTSVSLADLVAETLRAQSPLAAEKGQRLESDAPPALPPAWADRELIGRVLQNLVGNAIKFTATGGMVKAVVRQGNQEDPEPSHLYVSVSDNGPGIPAGLQNRLFQKFVTGEREGSGSGLGLAFCRLVAEAHGGRIWVESEPGQETTFTFALPVAQESDSQDRA
jgi:PAS domain S-box-containing protein